ncbi:DNA topoisomerase family protein, partial [Chlamydia psittaci 06-1683]
CFPDESCDL